MLRRVTSQPTTRQQTSHFLICLKPCNIDSSIKDKKLIMIILLTSTPSKQKFLIMKRINRQKLRQSKSFFLAKDEDQESSYDLTLIRSNKCLNSYDFKTHLLLAKHYSYHSVQDNCVVAFKGRSKIPQYCCLFVDI